MSEKVEIAVIVSAFVLVFAMFVFGGVVVIRQRNTILRYERASVEAQGKLDAYRQQCAGLAERLEDAAGRIDGARRILEKDRGEADGIRELCRQSLEIIGELEDCLFPMEDGGSGVNTGGSAVTGGTDLDSGEEVKDDRSLLKK